MSSIIFVFGSNLAGRHGKGAALHARNHFNAEYGVGVGRTGCSYAIPTKGRALNVLPLSEIEPYIKDFIVYANLHSDLTFEVTSVGCGLAGYSTEDMAPMFKECPSNCNLPEDWENFYASGI